MPKNWFQKPLRLPRVPHSMQDLSHNFKTTTKFGLLTPIGIEEVLPSDKTLEYRPCAYIRLSPLQYPIMHQVHARIHTFEVPYRIILGDKNYQDWLNSKFDLPSIDVTLRQADAPAYDIFTTLGYPRISFTQDGIDFYQYVMDNGLDYLALLVIWRDWYADSQINSAEMALVDSIIEAYQNVVENRGSSLSVAYSTVLYTLTCAMPKDYFTSARPEPQYGDPVNLTSSPTKFFSDDADLSTAKPVSLRYPSGSDEAVVSGLNSDNDPVDMTLDLTIRELWRREQIQKYWDTTNTFGSRTREWLAGHMGIIFPDDRLMIPRILQTVDRVVNISEVLQTSASEEGSPLGAYAGKGTLAFSGKSFRRLFVEHGFVISLLSIVPETGYAQSRPRYQFKKNIFDFAIPEFNNIGYQEIYKAELYGPSSDPKGPWAYVPRYSEYRSHPNRCSNGFSDDLTLRDFHLNRFFASVPGLNPSFLKADQDQFYRIFSDEEADMDSFLVDAAIIHKIWRPITYQPESMHL